jgi:hypothetical protein
MTTNDNNLIPARWYVPLRAVVDYLNGSTDEPPGKWPALRSPVWGVYWTVLLILVFAFSGQSSRFIYIDF